MGNIIRLFLDWFRGITKSRMLILGLDAAGKTTMLYKLKLGEVVTTIPTIVQKVLMSKFQNIRILNQLFGMLVVRKKFVLFESNLNNNYFIFRHYYKNTQGLIYVIDSYDKERFQVALNCLADIIKNEEMKEQPILIFANKNDLPNALTPQEIFYNANPILKDRVFLIQPCCAITGEGLYEGLDWFAGIMGKKKKSSIE